MPNRDNLDPDTALEKAEQLILSVPEKRSGRDFRSLEAVLSAYMSKIEALQEDASTHQLIAKASPKTTAAAQTRPGEDEDPAADLLARSRAAVLGQSLPGPSTEHWEQWELAPAVELHVRAGAQGQRRDLLRRVLQAAGLNPKLFFHEDIDQHEKRDEPLAENREQFPLATPDGTSD